MERKKIKNGNKKQSRNKLKAKVAKSVSEQLTKQKDRKEREKN